MFLSKIAKNVHKMGFVHYVLITLKLFLIKMLIVIYVINVLRAFIINRTKNNA
jgi:hypothetical protein